MSKSLKMGICQFAHRFSLIWLNHSLALEIKILWRAMSKYAIWKSDVPSSGVQISIYVNIYMIICIAKVDNIKFFQNGKNCRTLKITVVLELHEFLLSKT